MKERLLREGFSYLWLSSFFTDYSAWITQSKQWQLLDAALLAGADSPAALQEYDDLFKGTNAAVYIPLWASACKNNGDILLDETTLGVISRYYKWGYAPVAMDGNPPDYIGQQLRFLAYLAWGGLHGLQGGGSASDYLETIASFTGEYLIDTVRTVAEGILQYSATPVFAAAAEQMLRFFSGAAAFAPAILPPEAAEAALKAAFADGLTMGRQAEIPLGEKRIVNTAGRNNCGGKCIIRATVQEGCLLNIATDSSENFPQIRACIRGRGYRKTYMNGKRLRYPMQRIGERGEGRFRRISWEEAADIVAAEWVRIRDAYGPGSRYINYGTGISAVLRPDNAIKRLFNLDGGCLGRYNSYSSACTRYITPYIYGDIYSANSLADVLNTKLLILWGHNPTETIFGSERNYYLAKAREAGVRVIVIDPRNSDTAIACADQWIPIRPSTDSALADGMAYVIWSEGLADRRFMDTYCIGFDEAHMPEGIPENQSYEAYLFGKQDGLHKTPEWAEAVCGVPADTIRQLAREIATTKPMCLLPGLGIQRTGNGEQATRSLALLTCLTGNIGIPGGGGAGAAQSKEHQLPAYPTLPDAYPGRIPCFLWTTAIENGVGMNRREHGLEGVEKLESNMKMMVNLAGNTLVNQHSDINNTIRILKDTSLCEFILCSDVFMTSSALYADILLPGASFLEDENIATPWDYGSYLLYNNKAVEPLFEGRFEYCHIEDVARRLGLWQQWSGGFTHYAQWLEALYNELRQKEQELPEFSVFRAEGGYQYKENKPYIAYEEQISDLETHRFSTPSGKIEIFSKRLYEMNDPENIPAIPKHLPCPEGPEDPLRAKYPLQMIGWHTKRRCHSIHDNNEWLEEVEPQRMWIHPEDARIRKIAEGEVVAVFNDRGRVHIPAHLTDRVRQGVVAIPQGAWYRPDQNGTDTRGSINVLTHTKPTPVAKGNPQHTNLVEVARIS